MNKYFKNMDKDAQSESAGRKYTGSAFSKTMQRELIYDTNNPIHSVKLNLYIVS